MRVKHTEYVEFVARFYCAASPTAAHSVPVEIETASGDLAATKYLSDDVSAKAADWLKLLRIAGEVDKLDHPVEPDLSSVLAGGARTQESALAESPTAWTFESHRRDCPHCGRRIMKAATICGYCWSEMEPLRETPEMLLLNEGPVYREVESGATPGARRACPSCGKMMMKEAAICGFCWARG